MAKNNLLAGFFFSGGTAGRRQGSLPGSEPLSLPGSGPPFVRGSGPLSRLAARTESRQKGPAGEGADPPASQSYKPSEELRAKVLPGVDFVFCPGLLLFSFSP